MVQLKAQCIINFDLVLVIESRLFLANMNEYDNHQKDQPQPYADAQVALHKLRSKHHIFPSIWMNICGKLPFMSAPESMYRENRQLHSSFYLVWFTLNRYSYIIWDNCI
jgi:hypothetical protein